MASGMSNFLENELLDHVLSAATYTAPATLYLGLSTATLGDTDTGSTITEPAGGSYARASHANNATNWPAASSGSKSNGATMAFAQATGSWGAITDYGILDASSAGNLLLYAALSASKSVVSGNTASFASGNLTWSWDSTNISTYLRNETLDHVLSAATYTAPATLYMALCTAAPTAASTGSTITEVSGGSYAREAITNNATNFPAASGGSKSNGAVIDFGTATGTWGTVTHWALCDASSGGNVLFFGALTASAAPVSGDSVTFPVGNFTFSFN